jgi:alanine racemase
MHRLGFVQDELEPLIKRLKQNPGLRVQSVFSHLAASEDPYEDEFTHRQIAIFTEMSAMITSVLDYPVLLHILNSAGISRFPDAQFGMVRLGIGLYGVGSSPEEQSVLRNVSTLKSVVTQVKHIPAGDTIGYNRKGKAEKDMVIAIVPVGYADGLNRRLGNGRGKLWINGNPAPIVGNVCMDLTMVDVSHASRVTCHEGDEVIIFGDLHPVAELAKEIGTIPYEVLTGISRRVKRIYYYE